MRDEVFGPVAAITPFDDLDAVSALADDTEYGLAASVWTESLSAAHFVSAALRAGTVWIDLSPVEPAGEVGGDGAGSIIRQQPGPVPNTCLVAA